VDAVAAAAVLIVGLTGQGSDVDAECLGDRRGDGRRGVSAALLDHTTPLTADGPEHEGHGPGMASIAVEDASLRSVLP